MKIRTVLVVTWIICICLTGCSSSASGTFSQDTISLQNNKSLTYTIVTDFAESYYDVDELTQMAEEELTETGLSVSVQSAEVTDGVIHFTYLMASDDDYASFMGTSCYLGTIASAMSDSYRLKVTVNAAKDDTQITLADVGRTDYSLFIWNEVIAVHCPGKIVYYSTNLELTDDYNVVPLDSSSGPYYVVYK